MEMSSIVVHNQNPKTETRKGKRVECENLGGIRPQIISRVTDTGDFI